jgi:signal transduction histidine kinase
VDSLNKKIEELSEKLFRESYRRLCVDNDRAFSLVMALQWVAAILISLYVSPKTWLGESSATHLHVYIAVFLGGALSLFPIYLTYSQPGAMVNRYVNVVAQALYSALFIHLSGGRIESHFHVFASLAGFAFYRDLRVLLCGTLVVALDHAIRGIYFPESAFGVFVGAEWRWAEHAAWVLFEDYFLGFACLRGLSEMKIVARKTAEVMVQNEKIEIEVQKRTAELRGSRNAVKLLLDNAAQGFLSFNRDGVIGNDCSQMVHSIFRVDPAGLHISALFGQSREEWNEFVDLFFTSRLSFKEIKGLCPSAARSGDRDVAIDYEPILNEADKLEGVLVVATDVTEIKRLEKRAEEERSLNSALIKVLGAKNDFLELKQMVDELARGDTCPITARRHLHTIKGGFSLLEFHSISRLCHELELKLKDNYSVEVMQAGIAAVQAILRDFLEKNADVLSLKANAERTIPVEASRLDTLIREAQAASVPEQIRHSIEELTERPIEECLGWLNDAFLLTARRLGKDPEPIQWNMASARICPDLYPGLFKSLVHIARNSADHGIESPSTRRDIGKTAKGCLNVELTLEEGWYHLIFRDDGGGIDENAVRKKAEKTGLPSPKTSADVMRLLLNGEFSTKAEITETSGNGIGLTAVRAEVEKIGGSMELRSEFGKGTTVELRFPKLDRNSPKTRLARAA